MPEKTFLPIFLFAAFALATARWAPRWALGRPALAGVLALAAGAGGVRSVAKMPVELMPNAASETVTVSVNVRGGMPPLDVETLIVRPLEDALGDIPRLRTLFSTAKKDRCTVSLFFEPGANMKTATAEAHERVERTLPRLPPEIEKPVIAHFEEADAPVYIGAVTSQQLSHEQIRDLLEEKIKDRLLRAPGAANVELGGGRERKILVEADRDRLEAYGITVQRIASALGRRNVAVQVGSVEGSRRQAAVRMIGSFRSVKEMEKVLLARDRSGGAVFLENVATVRDYYLEPESLSRLNGRSAVSFYVQKESSANPLAVGREVAKALKEAWREIDPAVRRSLQLVEVSNQADSISSAMESVRMSLMSGVFLIMLTLVFFQSTRRSARALSGGTLAVFVLFLCGMSLFHISPAGLEWVLGLALLGLAAAAVYYEDLRPALAVGATIPLSALFCFILLKMSGFSVNVMSLFGLAVGIEMLVDNAVVVQEAIDEKRKLHPAMRPEQAAAEAAEEAASPLAGATLTNALVFAPFLFLAKDVQRLYSDVGAAVAASLFASLSIALTWVPLVNALDHRLPKGHRLPEPPPWAEAVWARASSFWKTAVRAGNVPLRRAAGPLRRLGSRGWEWAAAAAVLTFSGLWILGLKTPAKALYAVGVAVLVAAALRGLANLDGLWRRLMDRRAALLGGAALLALAGLVILRGTERDLQSSGELDEFVVFAELSSGARLSVADGVAKEMEEKILADAEAAACIKTLVSRIEGWTCKVYVTLKPRADRSLSTSQVMDRLRAALEGAGRDKDDNAFVHFSSARAGREMVVQVSGPDYDTLYELSQKIAAGMQNVRGFEDVKIRYRPGRPEVRVRVDPDRAAALGLTADDVAETAHGLMRGLRATLFRSRGRQVETIVRLREEDRNDLTRLADLPIPLGRNGHVPLGHVSRLELTRMPNEIFRENKHRLIQVTANLKNISLGRAAEEAQAVIGGISFPMEYYAGLEGDYEAMAEGLRQMAWGGVLMAFLVYLVLVVLFESLAQPLIIMAAAPLCLIGAAWGVSLMGIPVSNGVLMGVMILVGIAVNNAILLLDRLNARDPGRDLSDRLLETARARMRPIFLTAVSSTLGFLPTLLDRGESGALWRPLSITLVFGLLASTVLTIYVVPGFARALLGGGFFPTETVWKFTNLLQVSKAFFRRGVVR
ncbi:MAG: efflux RND transporter permease subunit [Elusimicrobiota bacterium]